MRRKVRLSVMLLVVAALAAVFAMYGRADFLVQLSNQLWSCF